MNARRAVAQAKMNVFDLNRWFVHPYPPKTALSIASLEPVPRQRPGGYGNRRGFLQLALVAALLRALPSIARPGPADEARPLKIVAFGDSLIAGFGLPADDAFPAVLERA